MENDSNNNQSQQTPPPTPNYEPTTAPATPAAPTPNQQQNGLAIAAMVVGIISILLGWVPFLGLAIGVAAIIMGVISLKHKYNKGMSITGIVTGAISTLWNLVISAILIIGFISVGIVGGEFVKEVNDSISSYDQKQQAKIDAKKDFEKGATAIFGDFEVKVNSVKRNYVPDYEYSKADDGNELIVVNITVKNIADSSEYFSSYSLNLDDNGNTNTSSYADVDNSFDGTNIAAGKSATGNVVFEIKKDSNNLKLQYEDTAYTSDGSEDLIYTLAI